MASNEGQIDVRGCGFALVRLGGCLILLTIIKFAAIFIAGALYYIL